MDTFLFLIFACIAVACAISVVVQTHPIKSAISLVGVMGSLAGLYLLLGAEFIAAAQVVVYAGAVMVLFVFVIMLLNAGPEPAGGRSWPARMFGIPLLVLLLGLLSYMILLWYPMSDRVYFGSFMKGGPHEIGMLLFSKYLLPFEVTSVLVLVAMLGAVVLAAPEQDSPPAEPNPVAEAPEAPEPVLRASEEGDQ